MLNVHPLSVTVTKQQQHFLIPILQMRKLAQGGSQPVSGALQFQPTSFSLKARTLLLYPMLPTEGEGLRYYLNKDLLLSV